MLLKKKSPHGGDVYSRPVRLDFSANINPAGTPEPVLCAVRNAAADCAAYPDPYCAALRAGIAEAEDVPADFILCGSGAAELIYSFAYALPQKKPSLVVSPTFSEYAQATAAAGGRVEFYRLRREDGFRLTEDFPKTDFSRYEAVFLCSPNNPTGLTVDAPLLEETARRTAEAGARLFCDLTFLDLTEEPGKYPIPALLGAYRNLLVLRAFTKSYAMAGLRLGYALSSDADFLETMSEKTPCWNVSSVAQRAGLAALGCRAWLADSVKRIAAERQRMAEAFSSLGLTVLPGEANFLLAYAEKDVPTLLAQRGIAVRDCTNFDGLDEGWFRAAVRTEAENDELIETLREVLL